MRRKNVMNEINDCSENDGPRITIDWAIDGFMHAQKRRDIIVIVDTLRFSSAVVTAVAHGFIVIPVSDRKKGEDLAGKHGAVLAVHSGEPGISISPISFITAAAGCNKSIILPSPNGAACATNVKRGDSVCIGCFLNASAVGEMITSLAHAHKRNVTVIACGEQRSVLSGQRIVYVSEESHRVFAIEDYLAAGAIITWTTLSRTIEAEVCARSFQSFKTNLFDVLRDSFSGQYLIQNGMEKDVEYAVCLHKHNVVPSAQHSDVVYIK
jgi:2-phosphosulfolactate phosphatase